MKERLIYHKSSRRLLSLTQKLCNPEPIRRIVIPSEARDLLFFASAMLRLWRPLLRASVATGVSTLAIDVWRLLHRFTLQTAILFAFSGDASTDAVRAFLIGHGELLLE
jgi:hypothetical protein